MQKKGQVIKSIQVLRFLAAMWVVVYHAQGWPQLPQMNEVVRVFFSWGFIGVDIFFVISGFLITTLLLKEKFNLGTINLKKFYIRRFFRIIPVVYLFILVLFILNYFLIEVITAGK